MKDQGFSSSAFPKVLFRHFQNRSGTAIMDVLEDEFGGSDRVFKRIPFGVDAEDADLEILVFPVLGDDRIPDLVEQRLLSEPLRCSAHIVCVSGDFTVGETPRSRVSMEAGRILRSRGSREVGAPILVDTPLLGAWSKSLCDAFRSGPGASHVEVPCAPPIGHRHAALPVLGPLLSELVDILPSAPGVKLWPDGSCRSLVLTDGAAYPRSSLVGLSRSKLDRVFDLISGFQVLESLSLAYAGLEHLPCSLPAQLIELDLTGNPIDNFRPLRSTAELRLLNLAACDLVDLPEEISALRSLHTLIGAKNRISVVPDWFGSMSSLRRLTLYRNQLTQCDRSLAVLDDLQILNIGASPITSIDEVAGCLPGLRGLGIGMTSLTKLPSSLFELPRLVRIDVSKNPQLDLSDVLPAHQAKLANSMLAWASADDYREIE